MRTLSDRVKGRDTVLFHAAASIFLMQKKIRTLPPCADAFDEVARLTLFVIRSCASGVAETLLF
jgi:hypothetical protein